MKKNFSTFFVFMLPLIFVEPGGACAVCFGGTDSSTLNALRFGILSLLLILGGVLFLFTRFFISFQKRAKQMP